MTATGYDTASIHDWCLDCGARAEFEPACACGRAYPVALVIPYNLTWSFDEALPQLLEHDALRLMGKLRGKHGERISELNHVTYLYLSRYPGLRGVWLRPLQRLQALELDYCSLQSLDHLDELAQLRHLKLTECRKLDDVGALASTRLTHLRITLCNRLEDMSPISSCSDLELFWYAGKRITSLRFLAPLTKLRSVVIAGPIADRDLVGLHELNLRELKLRKRAVSKDALAAFRECQPDCNVVLF